MSEKPIAEVKETCVGPKLLVMALLEDKIAELSHGIRPEVLA